MNGQSRPGQGFRDWMTGASDALVSVLFPLDAVFAKSCLRGRAGCRSATNVWGRFGECPRRCVGSAAGQCRLRLRARQLVRPTAGRKTKPARLVPFARAETWVLTARGRSELYEGALVRAIIMLKFERMEPLGAWFGGRLAEVCKNEDSFAADILVPVPLHRQRERERGYNQADLIARPFAKRLKVPYGAVLLVRTRPRPDKQLLSLSERWESVRGAFATRPGSRVDNLRVLLVDDVMTTGATLDACARVLRQAGAKSVMALTVARALRHPVAGFDE
jgi:competence protein ComFC